jgi:hypothetical protein
MKEDASSDSNGEKTDGVSGEMTEPDGNNLNSHETTKSMGDADREVSISSLVPSYNFILSSIAGHAASCQKRANC